MTPRFGTRALWRTCIQLVTPMVITIVTALGCSGDAATTAGSGNNLTGTVCQSPGASAYCPCANGAQGFTTCDAATGTWGQCICQAAPGTGGQPPGNGGAGGFGGTPPPVTGGVGGVPASGGQPAETALPCDIQAIVSAKCQGCHQDPTLFSAPMPLVSVEDFHGTSKTAATMGTPYFQLATTRITTESTGHMPPVSSDQLTDDEKTKLLGWLDGGAAAGTACGGGSGGAGGAGGTGGVGGNGGEGGQGAAQGVYPYGPPPTDCKDFYTMHAHGAQTADDKTPFTVRPEGASNAGNTYTCFYFDPPYAPDSQGLWFHPDLDKLAIMHHWLLYATDAKTHQSGTSAPCQAVEPGAYLVAGWAPGTRATNLPQNVGLHMPSGPTAGLILEVHHFNATPDTMQDSSGVTFCTAPPNTREHTAGVSFTGSEGICLNPNAQQTVGGSKSLCNPPDNQDIHIINIWPHMHKLGTRQSVVVKHPNGQTDTLHDKPFDFNSQITYPVNDYVMKAGDTLETTCTFQNTTAEKVKFGERTQDEMCYGFITAWPYQALVSDPLTIDWVQLIGTGIQQRNRCMNLVSIFDSCNGLLDYPVAK